MKKTIVLVVMLAVLAASAVMYAQKDSGKKLNGTPAQVAKEYNGKPATVEGYLRDTACLFRVPTVTKAENECLEMCVKSGAPLGIIAKDGTLYHPISGSLPDEPVRDKLVPYAGKFVRATGRVFERGGSHAIAIEKLEVVEESALQ
ncbi:MAG TPA: hypothetical protein VIW67_13905 [Terriglobales bacterium]|jgi:hypothetical protein